MVKGEFSGSLASKYSDEKDFIPYTLTFKGVVLHTTCDLDTYENLENDEYGSSFDEMIDNEYLKKLSLNKDFNKSIYKHLRLFTYDVVFNIIAVDFTLEVRLEEK